jgi:hypothetical protein
MIQPEMIMSGMEMEMEMEMELDRRACGHMAKHNSITYQSFGGAQYR